MSKLMIAHVTATMTSECLPSSRKFTRRNISFTAPPSERPPILQHHPLDERTPPSARNPSQSTTPRTELTGTMNSETVKSAVMQQVRTEASVANAQKLMQVRLLRRARRNFPPGNQDGEEKNVV